MINKIISRRPNGDILIEEYKNEKGQWHREDGPAYIVYYENNSIREEYYHLNDAFYRVDGPAVIFYTEYGKIHRQEYWLFDLKYDSLEKLKMFYKTLLLK